MHDLDAEQLRRAASAYAKQTYQNWKLVLPAKELDSAPAVTDPRVLVVAGKGNEVRNI
jgi:hypothetical protein